MESNDKAVFFKYLVGVSELYRQELSDAVIEIWWESLKGYPLESVQKAFTAYVKSPGKRFMPAIGDITETLEGSTVDNAALAWRQVYDAICSVGMDGSVCFTDPVIMQVISDMGGWQQLCSITNDEVPFRAKDFERLYRAHWPRREMLAPPKRFIGMIEAHNDGVDFGNKKAPAVVTHLIGAGQRPKELPGKIGLDNLDEKKMLT